MPKCTVIEQGVSYVIKTDETNHGLPAKDAEALETIARLAREGKSPEEIAAEVLKDHPEVAENSLHAYSVLEAKRRVQQVKELTQKQ